MTITEIAAVARRRRRMAAARRTRAAFAVFVPADPAALEHANAVALSVAALPRSRY
jgi:hypothetical protein